MTRLSSIFLVISLLITSAATHAQTSDVIVVKANQVKAEIKPTMYGFFFEDINFGADIW
ncbi:MAG: hypothetical protein M3040_01325 [Bacteroidota bacterium]|nr:hypothetical protein [Bacteroidota bacterium]